MELGCPSWAHLGLSGPGSRALLWVTSTVPSLSSLATTLFPGGIAPSPRDGFSMRFSFFVKCTASSEMSNWELMVGKVLPSLKPTGGCPLGATSAPFLTAHSSRCLLVCRVQRVSHQDDSQQHGDQWGGCGPHPLSEQCPRSCTHSGPTERVLHQLPGP